MDKRLSVVIAIGVVLAASPAYAQWQPGTRAPQSAAELAAEGIELYKTGDYAGAVAPLEQAHELEPNNFEYQYALAQALRQSSLCDRALAHYQALREAAPDPQTARDVRDNMALCPGGAIADEPPPPPPPPPPAPPPPPSGPERTSTWTNVALATGAGASLGVSVFLFLGAGASDDDADVARSFDDHERLAARADRMRVASYVTAGLGVGLAVFAIRRFALLKGRRTELAIAPHADGGAVVLGGSW